MRVWGLGFAVYFDSLMHSKRGRNSSARERERESKSKRAREKERERERMRDRERDFRTVLVPSPITFHLDSVVASKPFRLFSVKTKKGFQYKSRKCTEIF